MKKFSALVLSAVMLFSCLLLSSCGETVELMDFIGSDVESADYEGYVFECYFQNEAGYDEEKMLYVYDRNTLQGDALLSRMNEIKETINVNIEFNQECDIYEFQTAAMSRAIEADTCQLDRFNYMYNYAKAGLLYPITDFPDYIDLSLEDKYGAANVLEPGMVDSVPYVITPVCWPGFQPLDSYVLTYNTDIFSRNGLTNFHEFYENGTWTWETFENEFLKKAEVPTDSGLMPAIDTHYIAFFDALMYSNGTEFLSRNEDGTVKANTSPAEMIRAYEQGKDWCGKYSDRMVLITELFNTETFCREKAISVLALAEQLTTGDIAYNKFGHSFSYNIAPFPCGPDAVYGKWAQFMQRAEGWGICKTSKEPTVAAHTVALLFEPFPEVGSYEDLYEYYNHGTFLSETDTKIFFELMENVCYNYTFGPDHDIGRGVADVFGSGMKDGKSFAEIYEKHTHLMRELVYDYMLPNYDYMYENYYSRFEE